MYNQYLFSQWDEPQHRALFQAVKSCGISWEVLTLGCAKVFCLCPQWCFQAGKGTPTYSQPTWHLRISERCSSSWTSWAKLLLLLNTKGKCLGWLKHHHPQVALSPCVSQRTCAQRTGITGDFFLLGGWHWACAVRWHNKYQGDLVKYCICRDPHGREEWGIWFHALRRPIYYVMILYYFKECYTKLFWRIQKRYLLNA